MSLIARVREGFKEKFGAPPSIVVRAPGRVNLIGEHTDYNDGFVMPMAIDRATFIALRPREDGRVLLRSLDYGEDMAIDLDTFIKERMSWREYPKGVAWALREAGYELKGWEGVTCCDVPMGAGLSSSASFELAVARSFCAVSGFEWDAAKIALICQKAENRWVGVNCGIMDQMISAVGEKDHAVLIDCRSLETRSARLPKGTVIVVMDTTTRRGLVDSAYNERRAQCEQASRFFGVDKLRDVTRARFEKHAGELEETTRRRSRHVITEDERTLAAIEAMEQGDATMLGKLMNDSHESLRDDFEVSRKELDTMVDAARECKGCFGARMTGAGFGGCAMALVSRPAAKSFAAFVEKRYAEKTGLKPLLYVCHATDGAAIMK